MKVFYDQSMGVPVIEGSTPGHMKPKQFFQALHDTALPIDWETVTPSDWEDFNNIHDPDYVDAIRTGEPGDVAASACVSWSPALAESIRWKCGSMLMLFVTDIL